MSKKLNTDQLAAQADRRIMPKPSVKFRDKNRYNRNRKHRGRDE
jgi:hypothetical protein